jgi:hypothetical protein
MVPASRVGALGSAGKQGSVISSQREVPRGSAPAKLLAGALVATPRPASTTGECQSGRAMPGAGSRSIRGFSEFHPLVGKAEPEKSVSLGQCNTCKLATALRLRAQVIALCGPLLHRRIENASRHAGTLHPLGPRVVTRMPHSLATGRRA